MMLGAGEKAGSGIDKIRLGWESQHWRMPRVTEQMQPDRVKWMLPMVSLIPEESLQRLKRQFGVDFDHFSTLEVQALVTADIEKRVDNRRLQQITGEHAADITYLLQSLVAKRSLLKQGHGRWSWYHLPEIETHKNAEGNSLHKQADSAHSEIDSVHSEIDSVHKEGDSVHKDQWNELLQIAGPARSRHRMEPRKLEQVILQLCQKQWLTRREIGQLLNRNADGLRSRYLASMVAHGLLRLRFPDKPNRADQAYRSSDIADSSGGV
jgi:ATP-dependent DNA helicase RecG